WQQVDFLRWEAGLGEIDRTVNVEIDPNTIVNFSYTDLSETLAEALGSDTSLCANAFGVDILEVDSALGSFQWSFKGVSVGAVIVSMKIVFRFQKEAKLYCKLLLLPEQ